jgi:hypothetical protein
MRERAREAVHGAARRRARVEGFVSVVGWMPSDVDVPPLSDVAIDLRCATATQQHRNKQQATSIIISSSASESDSLPPGFHVCTGAKQN